LPPWEAFGPFPATPTFNNQTIRQIVRVSVVDFDAVLRDPDQPTQIKEGLHAGDHLHGSDAGHEAMAAAFPLSLLK